MKLLESLRLAEAANIKFTVQPTEVGATGVIQINAPLTEANSEILGVKPGPFGKGTLREHLDGCMLEFPAANNDVFGIEAEYVHKPVITEVETGKWEVELKAHVREDSLFKLLEFMCSKKKAAYHLIVRPLERTLLDGRDDQREPEGAFHAPAPAVASDQPGLGLTSSHTHKHESKKGKATITLGDINGGSAAEWSAEFSFRNARSSGLRSTEPVASEREALELAAGAVHAFAQDVFTHAGSTAEKKEAAAMMQWAEQWMSREQLTQAPDEEALPPVEELENDDQAVMLQ